MHNVQFATKREQLIDSPRTLQEAADTFFVLHVNRLSDTYRAWLETRIESLVSFLGYDYPVEKVTIWQLDLWYADLAGADTIYEEHPNRDPIDKGREPATLHGYVRAVKTLFNWLGKRRIITSNPADLLEPPPLPESPPKHAYRNEVRALLKYFRRKNMVRNYTAVRVLQATGLRANGLVTLRRDDIDFEERLMQVTEKGRGGNCKSRTVPFDTITGNALRRYVYSHNTQWAFISQRGGGQWSATALYRVMRMASLAIPLDRVVGPHMLRHYFGFEAVKRGLHLRLIQQIMGHESSKTTEIYTKFSPSELRQNYDKVFRPAKDIEHL